jgi:hypothetical protein
VATVADFKGLHRDRRVFILASGPSLAKVDLGRLSRRIVIGLNRSFLVYPDAHYHCTMDQRLFDEYPVELRRSRYLFTLEGRPFGIPLHLLGSEGFSFDLEEGVYSGYTVSYLALQLAAYMGFTEIFFLGLDLKHAPGHTHFFGWDYHSETHENTEFPKMRRMLTRGVQALRSAGIAVYNCSPESTLHGVPSLSLDRALEL